MDWYEGGNSLGVSGVLCRKEEERVERGFGSANNNMEMSYVVKGHTASRGEMDTTMI